MKQYLITVWSVDGKYSYLMGTNNIDSYKRSLNEIYNRYTVEERPPLNANILKSMRE